MIFYPFQNLLNFFMTLSTSCNSDLHNLDQMKLLRNFASVHTQDGMDMSKQPQDYRTEFQRKARKSVHPTNYIHKDYNYHPSDENNSAQGFCLMDQNSKGKVWRNVSLDETACLFTWLLFPTVPQKSL